MAHRHSVNEFEIVKVRQRNNDKIFLPVYLTRALWPVVSFSFGSVANLNNPPFHPSTCCSENQTDHAYLAVHTYKPSKNLVQTSLKQP